MVRSLAVMLAAAVALPLATTGLLVRGSPRSCAICVEQTDEITGCASADDYAGCLCEPEHKTLYRGCDRFCNGVMPDITQSFCVEIDVEFLAVREAKETSDEKDSGCAAHNPLGGTLGPCGPPGAACGKAIAPVEERAVTRTAHGIMGPCGPPGAACGFATVTTKQNVTSTTISISFSDHSGMNDPLIVHNGERAVKPTRTAHGIFGPCGPPGAACGFSTKDVTIATTTSSSGIVGLDIGGASKARKFRIGEVPVAGPGFPTPTLEERAAEPIRTAHGIFGPCGPPGTACGFAKDDTFFEVSQEEREAAVHFIPNIWQECEGPGLSNCLSLLPPNPPTVSQATDHNAKVSVEGRWGATPLTYIPIATVTPTLGSGVVTRTEFSLVTDAPAASNIVMALAVDDDAK